MIGGAIGCFVENCYYRGTEPNPDKLVFRIDGEVPIALLLFANMAKQVFIPISAPKFFKNGGKSIDLLSFLNRFNPIDYKL